MSLSSQKSNTNDSPKTPGGISKSFLTPCRRVGLSRKWKRHGPSPFISPLASNTENNSCNTQDKIESRKRKDRVTEEPVSQDCSIHNVDGSKTPSRDAVVPRKKKSKTLLSVINKSQEDLDNESDNPSDSKNETDIRKKENLEGKDIAQVSTLVRSKSKKKTLVKSNSIIDKTVIQVSNDIELKECLPDCTSSTKDEDKSSIAQSKVPNNLVKECLVVIQKKLFKKDVKQQDNCVGQEKPNSQCLFDSDSDNEPLIKKNKKATSDDEDFVPNSKNKKSDSKKLKIKPTKTDILQTSKIKEYNVDQKPASQSSLDEDDDFEFKPKKTIIIRNSYDKVKKPVKCKSTGSITQKDIDELKARIEAKKKILLAKAMTEDTKELRDLIKKWQKGCQDALMQLMDLMNSKLSDQKNMDYKEMLQMLKIPANMVGYDEENDCFTTPDDANIILADI